MTEDLARAVAAANFMFAMSVCIVGFGWCGAHATNDKMSPAARLGAAAGAALFLWLLFFLMGFMT